MDRVRSEQSVVELLRRKAEQLDVATKAVGEKYLIKRLGLTDSDDELPDAEEDERLCKEHQAERIALFHAALLEAARSVPVEQPSERSTPTEREIAAKHRITILESHVRKLEGALRKYGDHKRDCKSFPIPSGAGSLPGKSPFIEYEGTEVLMCTCGFLDALLSGSEPEPAPQEPTRCPSGCGNSVPGAAARP